MSIQLKVLKEDGTEICTAFRADKKILRESDWDVANCYWDPVGPYYGKAWVLCSRQDALNIEAENSGIQLRFMSNRGNVTCKKFRFIRARKIMASVARDISLYMVELGDRRIEFSGEFGEVLPPSAYTTMPPPGLGYPSDFYGTEGESVHLFRYGSALYPVGGLKCLPMLPITSGSVADDIAKMSAMTGAWFIYNPFSGGYSDPELYGTTYGGNQFPSVVPIFSSDPIKGDVYNIDLTCFVVPLHHKRLGSESNYNHDDYNTTPPLPYTRMRSHTRVTVSQSESITWDEQIGTNGIIDDEYVRAVIPFYGMGHYDPYGYGHGAADSILNKEQIEHDILEVHRRYVADSELELIHKIYDGFIRVDVGGKIKAVVYRARDGGGRTEIVQHPGMPKDFSGQLLMGESWSDSFKEVGLPGVVDGWRTIIAPAESIKVVGDAPDGVFANASICKFTDDQTNIGDLGLNEVWAVTVDSDSTWSLPEPGYYIGKLIWSHDNKAVYAVQPQGESNGLDWGWFEGTTTASMSGAGPHTITFVQRWGGKTVASPVYVWNNPALLSCPSGYSVWGIGQLSGSTWTIEIMQVKHQGARSWLDPEWGDTEYDSELGTVDGCALSARDATIRVMSATVLPDVEVQIQFLDYNVVTDIAWDGDILKEYIGTFCLPQIKGTSNNDVFDTVLQSVVVSANMDLDSLNFPRQDVRVFTSSTGSQVEIPLATCDSAAETIIDGGDVDDIHPYGAVVANTYPPVYGVD